MLVSKVSIPSDEKVTLRRVDVQLPPPPEPPPPAQQVKQKLSPQNASVDVVGLASDTQLNFSQKPEINTVKIDKIEKPTFDLDSINMIETLSVSFPVVGVDTLDEMPRITSSKRVTVPKELRDQGVYRVETKVLIIITENGRAYIKKLVDPVYTEMVAPIRDYIKNLQFTSPTKNGLKVQAEYMFNLNFEYRF